MSTWFLINGRTSWLWKTRVTNSPLANWCGMILPSTLPETRSLPWLGEDPFLLGKLLFSRGKLLWAVLRRVNPRPLLCFMNYLLSLPRWAQKLTVMEFVDPEVGCFCLPPETHDLFGHVYGPHLYPFIIIVGARPTSWMPQILFSGSLPPIVMVRYKRGVSPMVVTFQIIRQFLLNHDYGRKSIPTRK